MEGINLKNGLPALNFEQLNAGVPVYRASVPGGWLVTTISNNRGFVSTSGLCYIPDPTHSWSGGTFKMPPALPVKETPVLRKGKPTFDQKAAVDFALEAGCKYGHRNHAFNSLNKIIRDARGRGEDVSDPFFVAKMWLNYTLNKKSPTNRDLYRTVTAEDFVKFLPIK